MLANQHETFTWKDTISVFSVSQGKAEALIRQGGKIYHLLIAWFPSNISAKYYENPTMRSRVIAKNIGDVSGMFFSETQCSILTAIITRLFIDAAQWLIHGSNKFGSIFEHRIITSGILHCFAAFIRLFPVAILVVMHDRHIWVDVMVSLFHVMCKAPAVVMVHIDTRCRLDNGFHRVTRST